MQFKVARRRSTYIGSACISFEGSLALMLPAPYCACGACRCIGSGKDLPRHRDVTSTWSIRKNKDKTFFSPIPAASNNAHKKHILTSDLQL